MTVENTQNKMPPLQMGTATEYPFTFAVLLQDPTEEEALEAIKASVLQADGTEIELEYGTDYTVTLNTDRIGGTLTVNNIRTASDYLTIYRQYEQTQEVDYKDFNSAPAETFEQCFDKLTMLSQQQQEEINRSLKLNVSSTITNLSLPEPIANNTLIWDSEGTGLDNYDIIGENNQFKAEVNSALATGQAEIQAQFDTFENMIDTEIEDVREAADKINQLEEAVATATTAATNAQTSATNALNSANAASQLVQDAEETLQTRANVDLSNLSATGRAKFDERAYANEVLKKNQITNCILEAPNGVVTIDGLTITTKQGLKLLIPNGRNVDGTLNNIEKTLEQDSGRTIGNAEGSSFMFWFDAIGRIDSWGGQYVISESQPLTWEGQYIMWYNPATNLYMRSDNGGDYYITQAVYMGVLRKDSGQPITIFEPIQPFRAVDYSEYQDTPRVIETYVNGYSGYRIWSPDQTGRKRCQQWGSIRDTSGGTKTITFLIPFADTYYTILRNCGSNWSGGGFANYQNCYYLTTTGFTTTHGTDYDQLNSNRWYADGYIN